MTEIHYSRGVSIRDNSPETKTAATFEAFTEAVLSDTATKKGLQYIAAPFKVNGNGKTHRSKEGVLSSAFIALDLDGFAAPEDLHATIEALQKSQGFAYTTYSSKPDAPRARVVLATTREMDRDERLRASQAAERWLAKQVGDGCIVFDSSTHKPEQPLFTPPDGADVYRFNGKPLDVGKLLAMAPKPEPEAKADRPANAIDPVLAELQNRSMVIRELDGGKFAIRCPFEDEHTTTTADTSTVYMLPHHNGVKDGKIVCLHSHCNGRTQPDFLQAIGLDPKAVWAAHRTTQATVQPAQANLASDPTEDDLALAFSHTHAGRLRYVALWNRWLQWDGRVWTRDNTLGVYDAVRDLVRGLGAGLDPKARTKLLKAQTVAAVHNMVKADRRHAATVDQWDADDWLLNTPGGLIDLQNSETLPHAPEAYCTKITACAPVETDDCPLWLQFLTEVTDNDLSLVAFLQRLAGYAATGSTREHMLAFLYGTGRNGKGVFLTALQGVLADYAATAGMDVFTETHGDRHPTELAALQGARLVVAQETEEGRRWNESRIKTLTGGDPITARYMRQDFFTFAPKFTLLIAGNHKPGLRNVDEAIKARLHLVPFTVTIPKEKRDTDLSAKLRAEYPAILRWVLDGCSEYQRIGLAPPEAVRTATDEYLQGEDVFAQWLTDCCETGPELYEPATPLFKSWKEYADAANERPGKRATFNEKLRGAGYFDGNSRAKGGRHWNGLRLAAAGNSQAQQP